jgi:steroid 5-alpha reductase family enzyme
MRNFRKGQEDFRYRNWRLQWGKTFYWRTYLQVFLLQGFFQWIISLPIWIAATSGFDFMNFLLRPDMPGNLIPGRYHEATILFGAALWLLGFLFQAIGDYQLARFSKTKQPGQIMQSGLWKYSRHPNYFGEICMWWGIWLMVASFPNGAWAIISPVTITWLLAKVSGVPMLEKKYEGNPDFEAYKKRTPALFPWKPRKKEIN